MCLALPPGNPLTAGRRPAIWQAASLRNAPAAAMAVTNESERASGGNRRLAAAGYYVLFWRAAINSSMLTNSVG